MARGRGLGILLAVTMAAAAMCIAACANAQDQQDEYVSNAQIKEATAQTAAYNNSVYALLDFEDGQEKEFATRADRRAGAAGDHQCRRQGGLEPEGL